MHLNKANISMPSAALRSIPELYLQSGLLLLPCTWRSVNGTPSHSTEHSNPKDPASCSSPISLPLRNICTHEGCSNNSAFGGSMQHNQHQKASSICWKFPKKIQRPDFCNNTHPEMDATPSSWGWFTHKALSLMEHCKMSVNLRSRGKPAHSS